MRSSFFQIAICLVSLCLLGASPATGPATAPREMIGQSLGKPVYRDEIRTGPNVQLTDELHRLFTHPAMAKYQVDHPNEIEPIEAELSAASAYFRQKRLDRKEADDARNRKELDELEAQLLQTDLSPRERRAMEFRKIWTQAQLTPEAELPAHLAGIEKGLDRSDLQAEHKAILRELKSAYESRQNIDRRFATVMLKQWKLQRHLYDHFGGGRILFQQFGLEAFDAMRKWLETQEAQGAFSITDPTLRESFYQYWTTMKHGPFLMTDPEKIRATFLEPEWLRE